MPDSFAHCHVHTEFSMLDGASRVDEVVAAAAADGQPALGITDHGNMYGVLPFYEACQKQGIKPLIGTEAYMAHDDRKERINTRGKVDDTGGEGEGGKKPWYHLTLLAESNAGYKNLIQLASRAYLEGYYRKPKVDWDLLADHSEGVIATTGCLGGHVLQSLLADDFDSAMAKAGRLQEIFGRDNLFVELQDHGIPDQHRTNPQLVEIAKRIGAPLLATNDSHYTRPEDAESHDALLCVQTGALISQSEAERFKFKGSGHYLRSAGEMRHLFAGELEVACDNTLWIAERADVKIEFGKPQLPSFPLPEGFASDTDYLRHLTFEGARERWGDPLPDAVVERLAYELKVIDDMGFSSYFLIVWDLIKHARDSGIRVGPGRGSAAGCAVAYTLRITDLDPIKYDLLFERFLNPSRISMPDIDMDFDSRYRDEMIRYAAERYGRDHVAQIVTFSTIKARAAVRDAARVLGYPYIVGDKVAKAMPPLIMGRDTPLWACLSDTPPPKFEDGWKMAAELRSMVEVDPDAKRVVEVAKGLEGLRRQDGIHAAAVVITKEPLTEYLPIQRKPDPGMDPEAAPVVTQYEMHGVEDLGLLKMDFLGLRNLDVISDAVELIRLSQGIDLDIDHVPLDDPKTYELLQRGDSIGVFQLEGGPMRALMRSLAPTCFEDVAALVALYRPGPMAANMHNDYADRKNKRKPVEYLHPDAEELLAETYGLCLTGDTIVIDARSGRPHRLDEIGAAHSFYVQGVAPDLRPAVREVTAWTCNGEKEVVRLELMNGLELTGTPDHLVLTERGWREMGALGPDDHVAVPKRLVAPVAPMSVDRNRLRVLGNLLGDGGIANGAAVELTNGSADVLLAFEEAVRATFPDAQVHRTDERAATRVRVVGPGGPRPSSLLRWLRALGLKGAPGSGGVNAQTKFIPEAIFECGDEDLGVLLAAMWDCDGHVNEHFAVYTTTSARLADDVVRALMRLGFAPSCYRTPYVRVRDGVPLTSHQVTVFDGDRFRRRIGIHLRCPEKRNVRFANASLGGTIDRADVVRSSREAWPGTLSSLASSFGLSRLNFQQKMVETRPRIHEATVRRLIHGLDLEELKARLNITWVRVRSVVPAGRAQVYDITVDDVHSFVANGVLAHNCVYQESVMRVAQKFAGYSLAEADNLRKAMGKKNREIVQKERAKFIDGCERTGYGRQLGEKWMDIIEPFADYAFNRSHAFGYGYIAYQTAYLKANHPAEYLAALLTSVKANLDKAAVYLADCRALGIEVTVPDVNRSMSDFAPVVERDEAGREVRKITFGLSAVRNVGEGLVSLIVQERDQGGPFTDFYDFCERVDLNVLNKRTIESLIKAGGFDSLGHPRKGLLLAFEGIIDQVVARRRERDMGVMSLFGEVDATGGSFDERPRVPDVEFGKKERLAFEKEMLGLYVSDHPLLGAEGALRRRTDCGLADLAECEDGAIKVCGGVLTGLQRKWTKKGDLMAVFVLEDLQSATEVMVFPKTMHEVGHKLADDAVVIVKGRVDKRDDQPKLIAMEVEVFEGITDGAPPLRIRVAPHRVDERLITDLKALLTEHPGESQVFLHLGERQVLRLPDQFCVDTSRGLMGELRVLLGPDALAG